MPEGPEVRYLRELLSIITNQKLLKIESLSKTKTKVKLFKETRVLEVSNKGKLIYIKFKDFYLHLHMMLTGWIYINERPKYTKYILYFNKDTIYVDSMRKFTYLRVVSYREHALKINKLGLDILTKYFTYDNFYKIITKHNMLLSKFLLDQDKLCGIGNYMRSEVLYLAKINYKININKLTMNDLRNLYLAIRYVGFSQLVTQLRENKMKIPRDIKEIMPEKINEKYKMLVYEQKEIRGKKIKRRIIGGRSVYYV
jgi:endonuclease-8